MNEILSSLPAWVAWLAAAMLVLSGLLALIGSIGLLRLPDFYARVHAPTLSSTLGAMLVVAASMLVSLASGHRWVLHELLIVLFLALTSPLTAMLLMRAVRYRRSRFVTPSDQRKQAPAKAE